MTGPGKNILSSRLVYTLSSAWILFAVAMFSMKWRALRLLVNQGPVLPEDILASLFKLSTDGLPVMAMVLILALAALGAGDLALRVFNLRLDAGRRLTFALALGLAALSYFSYFIGIAGYYNRAGLAVAATVVAISSVLGATVVITSVKKAPLRGGNRWTDIAFVLLLVVVGSFLFSKALRPAVFYDAVTYHLGVPNYYLQEGGIKYIPYDSYSNFPFMAEMLYTLGIFIYGLKLGQSSSVLIFLAATLAVYDFSRSFVKEIPPAIPAAFFLLTPAFMENTIQYSCDLHLAYYTIMAVYCYFVWEEQKSQSALVLMGIFTGVCLGTKYVALVLVLAPAMLAVAYGSYKDGGLKKAFIRNAALFIFPAILAYMPWFLKNLLNTGNPFYPALFNHLGGRDFGLAQYAVETGNHPSAGKILSGLWEHPWNLFMTGPGKTQKVYRAASYLGPIALASVPLVLLVRGVSPVVKKLCLSAALMFVLWDMSFPLTRYLFPAVALLCLVSAYALHKVFHEAPAHVKGLMYSAIAFCLLVNISLGFFQVNSWTLSHGFEYSEETDEEFLTRRMKAGGGVLLYSYPAYRYINENSDRDSKVLIIGDAQHLYIDRRHLYTYLSAVTPYEVFREKGGRPEDVSDALKSQGITHIVYNPAEMVRLQRTGYISYPEKDNGLIEDFLKSGYLRNVLTTGVAGRPVYLFELL